MTSPKWNINPHSCALLVIDMQNDFVLEGAIMEIPHARTQIPAIKTLIDCCRDLSIPIIYTLHQTDPSYNPLEIATFPHLKDAGMRAGTDGIRVVDALAPRPEDVVLHKRRYSAFYQTDLDLLLRNIKGGEADHRVDTLIICGTVTNICCESTARDACFRDYKVVFGSDVCSAINKQQHEAALVNMEIFGRVMTGAEIIQNLKDAS